MGFLDDEDIDMNTDSQPLEALNKFEIIEIQLKRLIIHKGSERFDEFVQNGFSETGPKIHAVRRLSDNEVFRVGDELIMEPGRKEVGRITRLWISFEQMRADVGNLGVVLHDFYHTIYGAR